MIEESYACQYAMGAIAFQGMIFDVTKVFIAWWFSYKIIRFVIESFFLTKWEVKRKKKEKQQ